MKSKEKSTKKLNLSKELLRNMKTHIQAGARPNTTTAQTGGCRTCC